MQEENEKQKKKLLENKKNGVVRQQSIKMRNYKDSMIEAKKLKKETRNYISIFGTNAGKNVKAKSSLALEIN